MSELRSLISLSPARISAGYFVFGFCWLPMTDVGIAVIVPSQAMPTAVGLAKGWTFVGISTVLIFWLAYLYEQQMRTTQHQLETTNQQLQVLHRVFRHNIRNDLNVIQGYTTSVADDVTADRHQEELQRVSKTAAELLEISEKLKVIDRVDPLNTDPEPIDAASVVETTVSDVAEQYPSCETSVEGPDETPIRASESVRFAIREAIENAIVHFDGPTDECEVTVEIGRSGDVVEITVADNGPGIASDELRAIRSKRETPLVHTSSIGLWLVSWLTKLNDGSVAFETGHASGTIVTFEFLSATESQFNFADESSGLLPALASAD